MLNINIIENICNCLGNGDIVKFHKITRSNSEKVMIDRRLDEIPMIVEEFMYLTDKFSVKCIDLVAKHSNEFYKNLKNIAVINFGVSTLDYKTCDDLKEIFYGKNSLEMLFIEYINSYTQNNFDFLKGCCKNLKTFHVSSSTGIIPDNEFPPFDISALAMCKKLKCLCIDNLRFIGDISVLGSCESLEELTLRELRKIFDISPLANCKKLRKLTLDSCDVIDISPITRCGNLEFLDISCSFHILDISVLAECKKLKYVHCRMRRDNHPRLGGFSQEQIDYVKNSLPGLVVKVY
jgi:hypothetical protein